LLLHQWAQSVEALAHVHRLRTGVHTHRPRERQHSSLRSNCAASSRPSPSTRQPCGDTTSRHG
jgi:hypothetical protein